MTERDFDAKAEHWDEEPRRLQLAHDVAEAVRREVPLQASWDVLDFGCGTGLLALELLPPVGSVTGADTSAGMLAVLEKKAQERRLAGVRTLLLEEGRPEPVEAFDLVASSMTLHHVADTAQLLHRLHALLRPGGWVALADLETEDGTFHEENTGVHHFGFDREALCRELTEAGFDRVSSVSAGTVRKTREYPVFLAVGRKKG